MRRLSPFLLAAVGGALTQGAPRRAATLAIDAQYEVTFRTRWTQADFPTEYPSNAHWSPICGSAHHQGCSLFEIGTVATTGIKNVAERGSHTVLEQEIAAQSDCMLGPSVSESPPPPAGNRTFTIWLTPAAPLLSLVTMIAPSPDWFAGVRAEPMASGSWAQTVELDFKLHDAGTSDLTGYQLTSSPYTTTPAAPVSLVTWGDFGGAQSVIGTLYMTLKATRGPTPSPTSSPTSTPPTNSPVPATPPPTTAPVTAAPTGNPSAATAAPTLHPTTASPTVSVSPNQVFAPRALTAAQISADSVLRAVDAVPARAVSAADVLSALSPGADSFPSRAGLPAVSLIINAGASSVPVGGSAQSVSVPVTVSQNLVLSDPSGYKTSMTYLFARRLSVRPGQISDLSVAFSGLTVGRRGAQLDEAATVAYTVCNTVGCADDDDGFPGWALGLAIALPVAGLITVGIIVAIVCCARADQQPDAPKTNEPAAGSAPQPADPAAGD